MSKNLRLLARTAAFLKPFWWIECLAFLVTAVVSVLSLAQPWIQRLLIDNITQGGSADVLGRIILLLLGAAVGRVLFSILQKYLFTWTREKTTMNLRIVTIERLLQKPVAVLETRNAGNAIGIMMQDADLVGSLYGEILVRLVTDFMKLLAIVILMLVLNSTLAMIVLGILLLFVLLMRNATRPVQAASHGVQSAIGDSSGSIGEMWQSIRETKRLGAYGLVRRSLLDSLDRLRTLRVRYGVLLAALGSGEVLIWGVAALMLWIGGNDVIAGKMTVGELIAFWGYMAMVLGPLDYFVRAGTSIRAGLGAAERVFDLADTGESERLSNGRDFPTDLRSVSLGDLCFNYSEDEPLLDRISLEARPGERIGVIGRSGSGKSTLASLLLGLFEHESGSLQFSGIDIADLSLESLRRNIAIVPQEPYVFAATLQENVKAGVETANLEEVQEACTKARLHDFVSALPDGYETLIGHGHRNLSGGQKQRLAFARIFLRKPSIVILDEATSAMDAETARIVMKEVLAQFEEQLVVIISHHERALDSVDRIIRIGAENEQAGSRDTKQR